MMKLAIMQPYLFPYIGYFQLISAVDAFVIYDDVNYIKRGWINRNNLLSGGESELFTLEVTGASQNKLISQVGVGRNAYKLLKNIRQKYSKAPQFSYVFPLIEEALSSDEKCLSTFISDSLRSVCDYLGLDPIWYLSSDLSKDNSLKGADKILAICESLQATLYINPVGGKFLYDRDIFMARGIRLFFLESGCTEYPQFSKFFVPNLSIIDVMMFNDRDQCRCLLEDYKLC